MSVTNSRLRTLVERAVTSPEALFQLLVEGLEWPVPGDLTFEDVEMEWDPAELHLDPEKIAELRTIRQIPPLTARQDFGVFVLDFEGGQLPIGAIRRLVDRLVRRKRARTGAGQHPVWDLDDLLFFCFSGWGGKALHVVAFRELDGKRVLRVLSWGEGTTRARMDLVMQRGIPDLRWDGDGPVMTVETDGLKGFHRYREGIKSAAALSTRMAEVAQDVRDEVAALYEVETDGGPIRSLYRDVRDQLLADLTPERFADVYAQTMVYGLLTARIAHPEQFNADRTITALSFDNPFLNAIYARFREQSQDVVDIDELGLRELAEELAATDVDELLADFGAKQRKDDPVVFFYEDFLTRYDPQQRRDLGAFYTPFPVVRYMVRTVDEVLRRVFHLPLGVADTTTWAELSEREPEICIPENMDPDQPVARMVDPANGTGTFFVEWLRQVRINGGQDAVEGALKRMDALEISLASYAVAHLKVSLELPPDLRHEIRLPIYLGDTLGRPRPHVFDEMADPVSAEGTLADQVKFEKRHNIVIGNPPYDRVESAGTGGIITQMQEGGHSLFDDILGPARAHTIFSHHASLYNLYVYFWRWSLWQAFERAEGPAVVSLITASSWLSGPGFLGLRQLARELGDEICVVDLGGENKGARQEENVFDIGIPVSIVTIIRYNLTNRKVPARVLYRRIRGTRQEKLTSLDQLDPRPENRDWQPGPEGWHEPLLPATGDIAWESYPKLIDLLPWQQPGAMVSRTWPVAPDRQTLEHRWARFVSTDDPADRLACFVPSKAGRNITTFVSGLPRLVDLPIGADHLPIVRYGARSFDRQWTFEDERLAKTESPSLWASLSVEQLFMTSMTTGLIGEGPAAVATTAVPDKHYFRGSFGGKDIIPLYRDAGLTPNADPRLLDFLTAAHRIADSRAKVVTVERLFSYIYALLSGGNYTERFHIALETPGPRVPLTADPGLFDDVVAFGQELLWLHTFAERFRSRHRGSEVPHSIGIRWVKAVTAMPVDLKDVIFNPVTSTLRVGDGVLSGVRANVWEFSVSGMQVIRKWLGYRTAKPSGRAASSTSPLDQIRPDSWLSEWSEELRNLVEVLARTIDLMPRGTDLLDRVCSGPLIAASDLPVAPGDLKMPPKVVRRPERDTLM